MTWNALRPGLPQLWDYTDYIKNQFKERPVDIWYFQEISMDSRATTYDSINTDREGQLRVYNNDNITETCMMLERNIARRTTQIKATTHRHAQIVLMKTDGEPQLHISMHLPTSWQTLQQLRDSLQEIDELTTEWTK